MLTFGKLPSSRLDAVDCVFECHARFDVFDDFFVSECLSRRAAHRPLGRQQTTNFFNQSVFNHRHDAAVDTVIKVRSLGRQPVDVSRPQFGWQWRLLLLFRKWFADEMVHFKGSNDATHIVRMDIVRRFGIDLGQPLMQKIRLPSFR